MKEFINYIFKEFPPIGEALNWDSHVVTLTATKHLGIALTFLMVGAVFIIKASKTPAEKAAKQRRTLAKMIGATILSCGFTRLMELYAIWHNYAVINAYLGNVTAIMGLLTLLYIPFVIKALNAQITVSDIKESLEETNKKLEKMTKLTKESIERK